MTSEETAKHSMEIVLIGAGRLATNLGNALHGRGHHIGWVYSRTAQSAEALATQLGATATDDIHMLPATADIFIFAVSDAALPSVATEAAKGRERQLFVHTAGSMPLDIFQGLVERYGVMYPMQTFSREKLVDFTEIPVFIEASDDATCQTVCDLAATVSSSVSILSTEQRRYLHLAAVLACNFVNHCYDMAATLLERHGMSFDAMLPLIDETSRKVHTLSPREAQTGPAVRYDTNVIERQTALLGEWPDSQRIYEMMSKHIHQYATIEK